MGDKPKLIKNMSPDCRKMISDISREARETQAELIEKALKVYRIPALVRWTRLVGSYSDPTRVDISRVRGVPPEIRNIFKEACERLDIPQGRGFYLAALMLSEYSHNRSRHESGAWGPIYNVPSGNGKPNTN